MEFLPLICVFYIFLISCCCLIHAQQPYIGLTGANCSVIDNSVLGNTCNGLNQSCQAYLTFKSQSPYDTVSSISNLLAADPLQLSRLNSVHEDATFETDKLVLVPVNCSCSGEYYQANTSYVIEHEYIYSLIANNIFQGLSTCQAIQAQNSNLMTRNSSTGTGITVPLRCACPTRNQTDVGVNYLLSYLVTKDQSVYTISSIFGVNFGRTLEANGLSDQYHTIFPSTTLLVPLQNPPSSSQTIAPPPIPQPLAASNKSSSKTWVYVIVGALGGGAIALAIGATVFYMFFCKSKKKTNPIVVSDRFDTCEKLKNLEEEPKEFLESISSIAQSLKVYTFQELQSATENFSPSCWIKGSVYLGTINGDFSAIKKMNGAVLKEINLLNKINHFNLIGLSGICFNDGYWYLVYEYAVSGPLSDWIYYNNNDQKFLNWTERIQIALDVATGLNYLHSYTSPPHVHKNVNSTNVLLDSDFRGKITNFGLARSADGQEGKFTSTRHIVGTKGYMAPEYLEHGFVSPKLDVYAFGVLMLEILTGKEIGVLYEGVKMHLSEILIALLHKKDGKENLGYFMDPSLQGNYPSELAIFVVSLVDSCIKKDPSARPGMDKIVKSLSRIMTTSQTW